MFYNKSISNSLLIRDGTSICKAVDEAHLQVRKVNGTGLIWLIKKILCIFPCFRSKQHKQISEIYKNCAFKIEVCRDRCCIDHGRISLTGEEKTKLKALLHKVNKISHKKAFRHLRPYQIAFESTLLGFSSKKTKYKVKERDIFTLAKRAQLGLMRDPIKYYLEKPKFDAVQYFTNLRTMPSSERSARWDEVSPLDIGISTSYLKNEIIPSLKENDRKILGDLIDKREKLSKEESHWQEAVNILESEYFQKKNELQDLKGIVQQLWCEMTEKYPQYVHLLDDPSYRQEFVEWVIRDKLSMSVFFESRGCVELMKGFSINNHLATSGDSIEFGTNKVPKLLKDGEGYVPWTELAWDKIFVSDEYVREDLKYIDKKIGRDSERNLYYMPKRGFTEHNPTKNNYKDIESIEPLRTELQPLKKGENPYPDLAPIVSYEDNKPTVADTHVYIELRIPSGNILEDNGQRSAEMKVYPIGIARDTRVRQSKKKNKLYAITQVAMKALKEENVILSYPDQNEFYRTRKFTKLNNPIKLSDGDLQQVKDLFQDYQESFEKGQKTGNFKRSFQISLKNCTSLPSKVYKLIGKEPLPKKMPIYHCFRSKPGKKVLKYIHKLTPNKLQALGLSVFSRTFGARGKVVQKDLFGNTTWLQRATIALINENERFSPVAG